MWRRLASGRLSAWGRRRVVAELARQVHPFAIRRQELVGAPMLAGLGRTAHLFQRDRQVEVPLGVLAVQRQRTPVVIDGIAVAAEIVMDVAEVEVRLEEAVVEPDRPLVQRHA
jgi:hypothetical protein